MVTASKLEFLLVRLIILKMYESQSKEVYSEDLSYFIDNFRMKILVIHRVIITLVTSVEVEKT